MGTDDERILDPIDRISEVLFGLFMVLTFTGTLSVATAGRDDVDAFNKNVRELTGGVGAHVVCDMLRGDVYPAGLRCMARLGVNVSAGWQLAQQCTYNSAQLLVRQLTLDHTHYETLLGCSAATELYGRVFKPTVHREIYAFQDVPRVIKEMHDNVQTGIPIVRIAKALPASVQPLAR